MLLQEPAMVCPKKISVKILTFDTITAFQRQDKLLEKCLNKKADFF